MEKSFSGGKKTFSKKPFGSAQGKPGKEKSESSGEKKFEKKPYEKKSFGSDDKPRFKKSFGSDDKPAYKKSFGKSDDKPYKKSYGGSDDKPAYKKSFGKSEDKPYKKSFGKSDDKPGYKKYGSSDDKPYKKSFGKSDDKPGYKKSYGSDDKPAYKKSYGGSDEKRPYKKSYGGSDDKPAYKKSYGGSESSGDKKFERKTFSKKSFGSSDDKPAYKKSYGGSDDKPAYKKSYGGSDEKRPYKKSFGSSDDKPAYKKSYGGSDDKPAYKKSYGNSDDKPRFKKSFGGSDDKPAYKKSFSKSEDKPKFKKEKESGDTEYKRRVKANNGAKRIFSKKKEEVNPENEAVLQKAEEALLETNEDVKEITPKKTSKVYKREEPKEGDESKIRLNRFIAKSGQCSRREADELIAAGKIAVNGEVVTELGVKIDAEKDEIKFGGKTLSIKSNVYVLLNKPRNFIATTSDEEGRQTVVDLVKELTQERIYPVGRLDRNTTGLILLTNDGDLTEKLTHPSHEVKKVYQVATLDPISEENKKQLLDGFELEDGFIKADSISEVKGETDHELLVEIHSGRNRIVRRMFEHLGHKVESLDRVALGPLTKRGLPRGQSRFLTNKEIGFLKML